jgi:hypothetical protein
MQQVIPLSKVGRAFGYHSQGADALETFGYEPCYFYGSTKDEDSVACKRRLMEESENRGNVSVLFASRPLNRRT